MGERRQVCGLRCEAERPLDNGCQDRCGQRVEGDVAEQVWRGDGVRGVRPEPAALGAQRGGQIAPKDEVESQAEPGQGLPVAEMGPQRARPKVRPVCTQPGVFGEVPAVVPEEATGKDR